MSEFGLSANFEFRYNPIEIGSYQISKVFTIAGIEETISLTEITMPVFHFDPIFVRVQYREYTSNIDVLVTLHNSLDEALFKENTVAFSLDNISKNPSLFPYSNNLVIFNANTLPDVEKCNLTYGLLKIAGQNKFAIFEAKPHFV